MTLNMKQASSSTSCIERGVIATLWQNMNDMLMSGTEVVESSVWLFMSSLPAVEDLEKDQLPALSRLHLSSASNLMATIKLLAPRAFAEGASSPDELLLAQLDGNLLDMVSCLVELQLFHLQRAALLAAHSRRHMKHACHMHSSSCLGSSAAHSGTSHCQTTDSSASLHTL